MREAGLWKKMPDGAVSCYLCQRRCYIKKGEKGFCHVRQNVEGKLYSLNWGKCVSYCIDPIEKKPFYHFMPGSNAFSFAAAGCNFRCEHCFTGDTVVCMKEGIIDFERLFDRGKDGSLSGDGTDTRKLDNGFVYSAKGKLEKVAKVTRHSYTGKISIIKAAMLPEIKCTPEHSIHIMRDGKLQMIEAQAVRKGDLLIVPKLSGAGRMSVKISEIVGTVKASAKRAGKQTAIRNLEGILEMRERGSTSKQIAVKFGLHPAYVRTFLSKFRRKLLNQSATFEIPLEHINGKIRFKHSKECGIADETQIDEDVGALIGFYCAEGSSSKCPRRPNSYSMRFCLGKHEKELAEEIQERFRRVFKTELSAEDGRTTRILRCSNSLISMFFRIACGSSSYEKQVPYFIFDANAAAIHAFLVAYNKGDGWNKGRNHPISMDTVSKKLAFGLLGLFLRIGILPFYYEYHPSKKKSIEGREVNQATLHYVKLYSEEMRSRFEKRRPNGIIRRNHLENDDCFFVPIKHHSTEDYVGYIYNMEVEGEHSYLANFIGVANCQNWEISQPKEIFGRDAAPEQLVELAVKSKSDGIAYTYTEPTIFYEYAKDTAVLARKKGLYNVFVSNGYMTPETIETLGFLDAARIDLKAFTDKFYKEVCGEAHLEPVLQSIKLLHKKMHVEIITLLIPTLNDSDEEIRALSKWVKGLDANIPLHFTAYYPANRMTLPPTPVETLVRARKIALEEGLRYVYTGNRPGDPGENTYCPECNEKVIARFGMEMIENNLMDGNKCPECKTKIPIVFDWKKQRK